MKHGIILLTIIVAAAFAAGDAAIVPVSAKSEKPALSSAFEDIWIPQMMSFQGKLTDTFGIQVADTTHSVVFRLYTVPSGGTAFWNETQTVRTRGGLFAVLLGEVESIEDVPGTGALLYLGMAVNGGAELAPRARIASAAYAYLSVYAGNSNRLQGKETTGFVRTGQANSVTSAMITNATIAAADLGQMGASTGQVMKWTGSAWAPRNDSIGSGGSTPDSVPGSFAVSTDLRVYGKGRIGAGNSNSGAGAFVAGEGNTASATYASVPGGADNTASGSYSHISGGGENRAEGDYSTVSGGTANYAAAGRSAVAGGSDNEVYGLYGAIGGGWSNVAGNVTADSCITVSGGRLNSATGRYASIGGGRGNIAMAPYSAVLSGYRSLASDTAAVVCGGDSNSARGRHSFVGGGKGNSTGGHFASGVGGWRNRADSNYAVVSGGYENRARGTYAAVAGGRLNVAEGEVAAVGGGHHNRATAYATVAGGGQNVASSYYASIAGGHDNTASSERAAVAGGWHNSASGFCAAVGGGYDNVAGGDYATVGGGDDNSASGARSTVPGGEDCAARGNTSLAAGRYARANHNHSFVWSDSAAAASESVYTTDVNQFRVRARGGTWFFSNAGQTTGAYLAAGSNSWASACDSANKEDFREVDRRELLEKLAALRVREYRMRDQQDGTRHIGPVAQDFAAAFGVGESDKSINMADADGVLFAAVQALYEELRQLRAANEAQRAEIATLKDRTK